MVTASASFPEWLYISTIVAYCILILPTIFVWRKHGRQGFLGWNFVYGFCAIRITGAALSIVSINKPGLKTTAAIVNSMAISPLLLAALGVLAEARKARYLLLKKRLELAFIIVFHVLVTAAMVLLIIAIVNITKGTETAQDSTLMKLGLALLVVAWIAITVCTIFSLRAPTYPNSVTFNASTKVSSPSSFTTFIFICTQLTISSSLSLHLPLFTSLAFASSTGSWLSSSLILLSRALSAQRSHSVLSQNLLLQQHL